MRLYLAVALAAVLAILAMVLSNQAVTLTPVTSKVPPPIPQRIMSTNLCSDILLLMLVPKYRIVSITNLAHGPVSVLLPGADNGIGINHGSAEEVVSQRPDLILASPWSTPALRKLASRVGAPIVEIDSANSFSDIRRITRQVGAAVGERGRAEELITVMDRKLALLEADKPQRSPEVAAWSSGDVVPGEGTLTDAIIRAAGARNLAWRVPATTYSTFGVEEILAARPDVIMRGEDRYDGASLRDAVSEHPVLAKAYRGRRVTYPASLYACGLPQSADAAMDLRRVLAQVPQGRAEW